MPYKDGQLACMGYSTKEIPGKGRYSRFWIRIIDEDGNTIKEHYVEGTRSTQETILCASTTPDGGFIGAGKINVPSKREKGAYEVNKYFIKVNAKGVMEWEQTMDDAFWEGIYSVVPSVNGGFVAGGYRQYKGDKKNRNRGTAEVIRLGKKGEVLWKKKYGTGHYDYISSLIEKKDGSIVFMGRDSGNEDIRHNNCGSQGFWIVGLNAKGQMAWENFMMNRSTGTGAYSKSKALIALESGGFLVGGSDMADLRTSKLWMALFDAQGKLIHEEQLGEKVCHGVGKIVPTATGYTVVGWNHGYNTYDFEKNELGIHVFDTWTMDMTLTKASEQGLETAEKLDSTVSQSIAYQEQQGENPPHMFVEVHNPEEEHVHVYPNPAKEYITIKLQKKYRNISVRVFDMKGREQMNIEERGSDLLELNIGQLKRGTYLIVLDADGMRKQLKFVKE